MTEERANYNIGHIGAVEDMTAEDFLKTMTQEI